MSKPETLPPECREFQDGQTGASIMQWTSAPCMNHHFYFTNPTTSPDGAVGYFVSYRTGAPNVFAIQHGDRTLRQLSDRCDINPFSPAASATQPWIYFSAGTKVFSLSALGDGDRELCAFADCSLGNCSLSADGKLLAVSCRRSDGCELAIVDTATGKIDLVLRAPEVGHIQFCPSDSSLLMYSGTIRQRIWIFDRQSGQARQVVTQNEGEWLVHESWLGRGEEIIFPHWPHSLRAIRPDGSGLRTVVETNAWHACSNRAGTQVVCDTNHPDRGLLLVDPQSGSVRTLCHPGASQRGTQWRNDRPAEGAGIDTSIIRSKTPEHDPAPHPDDQASTYGPQWSHPHPTFALNGRSVIFTSDRDRWSQVYQVAL